MDLEAHDIIIFTKLPTFLISMPYKDIKKKNIDDENPRKSNILIYIIIRIIQGLRSGYRPMNNVISGRFEIILWEGGFL